MLYELLTGKTPFDAKELLAAGLDQMRQTIREKEPARPSTRLNTLQPENEQKALQAQANEAKQREAAQAEHDRACSSALLHR